MPVHADISRQDRWRALALLLGVLALAYAALIHPWWSVPMLHLGDEIAALKQRAARIEARLAQAAEIRAALAQLAGGDAPGFMPEASVQLATAALVQRLETTVRSASPGNHRCAIMNRTPLVDPHTERFPRVVVAVRLSCANAELGVVLHALESGTPRLFVDKLSIIARRGAGPGSHRGGGVDVSFELSGYLLPPARPPGAVADAP